MYVCRSIILIDTIIMWIRDIGRFNCQSDCVLQNKTENKRYVQYTISKMKSEVRNIRDRDVVKELIFFRHVPQKIPKNCNDLQKLILSDLWELLPFRDQIDFLQTCDQDINKHDQGQLERTYTRTLWSSRYSFHEDNDTVAIVPKVRTTRIKIPFEVMINHGDPRCSQTVSQRVDPQISFESLWRRLDVSHFYYHVEDDHSVMKVHHVPPDLDHESTLSQASRAGINLESLDFSMYEIFEAQMMQNEHLILRVMHMSLSYKFNL